MNFTNILPQMFRKGVLAAAMATGVALAGCSGWIYDEEGDCDPHYKVKFRYDYNLKKADAFAQEVNAVTLYVVEPLSGAIVWRKTENSEALKREDYVMDVDGLEPGRYKLLAWAGDGHIGGEHFTLNDGAELHTDLSCRLNRTRNAEGKAVVSEPLKRLYKDLAQEFEVRDFSAEQGTHVHTVRLMKNTNDVTIVLQHLSGEPVDPKAFDYTITEENGLMGFDNSLLDDEEITYRPHTIKQGIAAGYVPENLAEAKFSAAIAEFTTGRLMADRKSYLTITRRSDGEIVARVPVTDYALMVKARYEDMPDQEYLDRQDQYSMVFFLDEGLRWVNTYVYINSWHVVLQPTDL